MNFLLNLVLAGGMVSPLAAAPNDGFENRLVPADSVHVVSGEENGPASDGGDHLTTLMNLNNSYTISNPYNESPDKPFTIATNNPAEIAAPLATKVSCGGRIWTDGEYLGRTQDDRPVNVKLVDNRIYLNWGGNVAGNIWILFSLKEGTFQDNGRDGPMIDACVNPVDPSTAPGNLLGRTGDGRITCKGVVMPDGDWLGTFVDNGNQTLQFIRVVNGLLRIAIKQGANDPRTDNYNMSLMNFTIQGANGSFMSPVWRNVLTTDMVDGCFWPIVPKPATPVADNNCPSGPTVTATSNVSQTGLQFTYSGSGVTSIKWRIKQNGSEVRTGTASNVGGSSLVSLTYNTLSPGTYSIEIEGANCTSSVSSRNFTVEQPGTPDCQNGPVINTISSITPSSATIGFGGGNLHTFSWRILQGSYAVASGQTGYINNNSTGLTFNYLNNGNYTMEITAIDCKASSPATRDFSVSANDTRSGCTKGPSLQSVMSSTNNTVEFLFDGENIFAIDWKIMDGNTPVRQNRVAPQNNHPVAQFNNLPDGVYTLQIQGGNCKSSVSSARFGINQPLPIYISNFKGDAVEKGVQLTWEVVSEQDGKEFEVLRYDGKLTKPEVLGTVSLTDQRTGTYHFLDESPLLGVNYYQLKQIDIDGTFTTSKIVSVNPGVILGTVIAPNPSQDYLDIQFSSRTAGASEVLIYNLSGSVVGSSRLQIVEGKNNHRLNVRNLGTGNYFMKISHGGEVSKLRFTKLN